jgi:nucleoside-diphosphate-sugar epimerase
VPSKSGSNLLAEDLDHILAHTAELWGELRGERLFITGGTGFFGCWLLESFAWANEKLKLGASALVLSRNCTALQATAPHLAVNPAIRFHRGEVRDFSFPAGEFSHIIHAAATPALATFNKIDPLETYDIVVEGTRRTLEFAKECRARKFLFTSSGSVYGKQPAGMGHIPEEYNGSPDSVDPGSFLGVSKRAAECLCALYAKQYGIEAKIARCFSFVGPYLPLDVHYAIGNFIRDGLNGGPIRVNGDGTPCRSYLYGADLAIALWTILLRGDSCRAYNVGSEESLSIAELATTVAGESNRSVEVIVGRAPDPNSPIDRYVPSTQRVQSELGLRQTIDLRTAIQRTAAFALAGPARLR